MDTIDFDYSISGYDLTSEPEHIFLYNGRYYCWIVGLPTIKLPEGKKVNFKNPADFINTAYHPSYKCKWKIVNGKLYLIELIGTIVHPYSIKPTINDNYKSIDLNYLYPGEKEVFAEWYSGNIGLVSGYNDFFKYYNDGKRVFPEIVQLRIENGMLINEKIEYNVIPFRFKIFQILRLLFGVLLIIFMIISAPIDWLYRKISGSAKK